MLRLDVSRSKLTTVVAMDESFRDAALAIYAGDAAQLAQLLANDSGLAWRRSTVSHPTLLQLVACEARDLPDPVASAVALLDAGAEPTGPLIAAAGCGSREVLDLMLERGTPVDGATSWTPLDEAIYWSQLDVAVELYARGASMGRLRRAAGLGHVEAIGDFFDPNGRLIDGAGPVASPWGQEGSVDGGDELQNILDHAFVMAINAGQPATAEVLLARGAHVNAKPPGFHWRGTALHAACWRNHADIVQWLLDQEADPAITDDMEGVGADAIGWARHHQNDHLVPLLEGSSS